MNHIGLFEGVGGFSLAARWMGWETIAWCEWNSFGQQVLKYHFPNAKPHGDITKTDFTIYRGQCYILTGGFPCQPYSQAGKRKGKDDNRHLWPEMLRAIREIQPRWVVGENVRGLTNWNGGMVFDEVQSDLEAQGYEVLPFLLPACAVNAPHRRDRIWFVAYADNTGASNRSRINTERKEDYKRREGQPQFKYRQDGSYVATPNTENIGHEQSGIARERRTGFKDSNSIGDAADTHSTGRSKERKFTAEPNKQERQYSEKDFRSKPGSWQDFPTEPPICGRNDGISTGLAGITFSKHRNESIKAYGNAVVPQVVLQIFKAIQIYENDNRNNAMR